MNSIRIAIADDYAVFREALKTVLSDEKDMEIVLEAADGNQLMTGLENTPADIVILDLKMPNLDGKKATPLIREKYPHVKVLVLSMYADELFITKLKEMGAHGYLLKESSPTEIRRQIRAMVE